ncbi:hypothetical protein PSP20601_05072 [Pandoraea sputorum]|nr:hypothetical protein PSP20601_05072 [Pandoraea sputorum]
MKRNGNGRLTPVHSGISEPALVKQDFGLAMMELAEPVVAINAQYWLV